MYWQMVIDEILNPESPRKFYFTEVGWNKAQQALAERRKKHYVRYELGNDFPDIYLTQREHECAMYLITGKTLRAIAEILDISPRTVESYVNNIKQKVDCRTRSELVRQIVRIGFVKKFAATNRRASV